MKYLTKNVLFFYLIKSINLAQGIIISEALTSNNHDTII